MPEPCAVGHAELGPRGLKLVAGPHWKPPMNRELARVDLPDLDTPPLVEVLLVPQAISSGPPKARAPAAAESRRKSRLDLREKMLIFTLLSSNAVPWMSRAPPP